MPTGDLDAVAGNWTTSGPELRTLHENIAYPSLMRVRPVMPDSYQLTPRAEASPRPHNLVICMPRLQNAYLAGEHSY